MEDMNLGSGMPKVDIRKYNNHKCDKCGSIVFDRKYIIKEVSGLELGVGSETFIYPIDVLVCSECGTILKDHREDLGLEKTETNKEENNSKKIDLII